MAADIYNNWVTLKDLVKEIIFETDRDDGFYKKCMHFVINGLREMNKFHYNNIRTIEVTSSSVGILPLPGDYIEIVALSFAYGGLMYPLTRKEYMITPENESSDPTYLDTGGNYLYSTGGGKNDYYYVIEERNNRIIVANVPTRTLYLQYISSDVGYHDSRNNYVPIKLKEALKYYVLYKEALTSDYGDKQLVQLYKREYEEEVSKIEFLSMPTAYELLDILYETYRPLRR